MELIRLMDITEVTETQLATEPDDVDFVSISCYFDSVELYFKHLELVPCEQQDVKTKCFLDGTQTAMSYALTLWKKRNPEEATYKNLIKICLKIGRQETAFDICNYLKHRQ